MANGNSPYQLQHPRPSRAKKRIEKVSDTENLKNHYFPAKLTFSMKLMLDLKSQPRNTKSKSNANQLYRIKL